MTQLQTEFKSHCVMMQNDKEYLLTHKQYENLMDQSSQKKVTGIWMPNGDYINFRDIRSVQEIDLTPKTSILDHFMQRTKGAPKAAYEAMLRGFDRAIKEGPGSYKLAKQGTIEMRKKIVKKIESYNA